MKPILTLLACRFAALRKIVRDREGAKVAVMGAFAVLFGVVMVGEYVIFRRAFDQLIRELGSGGPALTLYAIESFLVVVWFIALLSFVVSGLWVFYRAADTPLLLSMPLPLGTLYWLRATETFSLTSWAFGVLGLPALLALGVSFGSGWSYYLQALGVLALFMVFTGAAGALLTALTGTLFRRFGTRTALLLAGVVLLGAFVLLVGRHVVPSAADFAMIFEPGMYNGKPASIKFIETKFSLWPSHPFAVTLYASATGWPGGSGATALALGLGPLLAVAAAAFPGRWLYRGTLPVIVEGFAFAGTAAETAGRARFPRLLSGPVGCLLERDLLRLSRNPREFGQAAFLLALLALYIAFLFAAPFREAGVRQQTVAQLLLLNLVAAGYFLTAFGLRFVFPSLSLEGQAAWVLFASPVRLFRLFLGKLAFYAVLLFLVVGSIALVGTLRFAPALLAIVAVLLALVTVTTVAISLAFGTLWPNFKDSNPESLATNAGGLATTFLCLGYVAAVGWLGRRAALALFAGGSPAGPLLVALGLSIAIVAGVVGAARRKLARLEVV